MTASPARGRDRSRSRQAGFNVLAVLLGLTTGLGGTGGLLTAFSEERLLHRVHDAAPSLVLLIIAVGCACLVGGRRRSVAAMQQVAAGFAGLAIGWAAGGWFDGFAFGFLAVCLVLAVWLVALHPLRQELLVVPRVPRPVITTAAVAVAAPLLWFAFDQASLQRWLDPANPHVAEGHYAGMAAAAVAFALLALLAAARTQGARLPTWSAGLGIAAWGAVSVATPLLSGSFPVPWGMAALGGGLGLLLAGELEARRLVRGTAGMAAAGTGRRHARPSELGHP